MRDLSAGHAWRYPPAMSLIPAELVRRILEGYVLDARGIHGLAHWARVLETGLRLAPHTGADPLVVATFAVFHDSRRENDHHDPEHGLRGARLAEAMRADLGLDAARLELLRFACTHHTDGSVHADPTIGTCWDADRLDLWRVGITPRARFLCTAAARGQDTLDWARPRSRAHLVPPVVADWSR
jgi:uncharacterized protein